MGTCRKSAFSSGLHQFIRTRWSQIPWFKWYILPRGKNIGKYSPKIKQNRRPYKTRCIKYIGLYRWQFILEFPMAHQSDNKSCFFDDFSTFRMNLWKRPFRLCSSFIGEDRNSIKQNTGLTWLNRPKSQCMHDLWNDREKTSMTPNRNDTEKIGCIMVSFERIGGRCPPPAPSKRKELSSPYDDVVPSP